MIWWAYWQAFFSAWHKAPIKKNAEVIKSAEVLPFKRAA